MKIIAKITALYKQILIQEKFYMNTQNKKIIPKIIALIVVLVIGITSILIITNLNNNDGKVKIQASTVQIERKNGSLQWYALYKVDGKNYATILDGDNSKLSQFNKGNYSFEISIPKYFSDSSVSVPSAESSSRALLMSRSIILP